MKSYKIIVAVLICATVGFSVWNKVRLDEYQKIIAGEKEESQELRNRAKEIEKAIIRSMSASLRHLGKTLLWEKLEPVLNVDGHCEKPYGNIPKLVLVLSELGCDACRDSETAFAKKMATKIGKSSVLAIVHANDRRYVRNYIRVNQVNFPVYFSEDFKFLEYNDIRNTPMIFFVGNDGRVLASHFPLPGLPQYSEPFHRFVLRNFEATVEETTFVTAK